MISVDHREYTIDSVLIEDYVKEICDELDIYYERYDFSDVDNYGYNRDTSMVTIVISMGSHITLEGLTEIKETMSKIDNKFGENSSYLIGAEDDLDNLEIRFDAPLKDVLE